MTAAGFVTGAFLLVSVLALVVQSRALTLILRAPETRPGLVRTAVCRVVASVIYVLVGLNAATTEYTPYVIAFGAFAITQLTWMANGLLDVRLTRPRRRRTRWRIQITITRAADARPSPGKRDPN